MKKTSKIAAKLAETSGLKSAHYKKILNALERYKKPKNYKDIARTAHLDPVQVARRLSELCRLGLVTDAGTTSKTDTGRIATNYKIAA